MLLPSWQGTMSAISDLINSLPLNCFDHRGRWEAAQMVGQGSMRMKVDSQSFWLGNGLNNALVWLIRSI